MPVGSIPTRMERRRWATDDAKELGLRGGAVGCRLLDIDGHHQASGHQRFCIDFGLENRDFTATGIEHTDRTAPSAESLERRNELRPMSDLHRRPDPVVGRGPCKGGGPGRRGPSGSRVSLGSRWLVGGSDRGQHQGLFILRSRFVRQPSIHQGCRARCGHFSRWQRWGARLHGLSASTERFSWRRCRGVRSETCQGCA